MAFTWVIHGYTLLYELNLPRMAWQHSSHLFGKNQPRDITSTGLGCELQTVGKSPWQMICTMLGFPTFVGVFRPIDVPKIPIG